MRRGLIVGKFMPPHLGHSVLIDAARGQCDELTVFVCDMAGQTIPGELRVKWLREMHPDVTVRRIDDLPPECDTSEHWARYATALLGGAPGVIFTSEDYGDDFARFAGCEHVQVDVARSGVRISATTTRADPLANLRFLAPCVWAHYVRRVCVVGAESTGKTTLCRELANAFDTTWVAEYGREYTESKLARDIRLPWRAFKFAHIAREQSRREDEAARNADRVLICDTDQFATRIWYERYLGAPPAPGAWGELPNQIDLYLLTGTDVPFEDDSTRDGREIREWMNARFVDELEKMGTPCVVLRGDKTARFNAAAAAMPGLARSACASGTSWRSGTTRAEDSGRIRDFEHGRSRARDG
ncbi:MAG TPA: AAA family ATPase [Candidatus Eremiobacteraceae bacterium]